MLRLMSLTLAAVSMAVVIAGGAKANPTWDPEGRFTGGAPMSRGNWNLFGGGGGMSPVPRQTISYPSKHAAGTIVINTKERRLYYILGDGRAIRYGIGVGRIGFQWAGVHRITAKKEWPSWTPPAQMLGRQPGLPRFMKG
jgi:lipoprotein-anchoring transpeptidase ErfK/SrfK